MNTPRRTFLVTMSVLLAVALQTAALPRFGLPGATPDLVLLLVVSLALVDGPLTGAVVGFAAGFALDLVPPADHAVGRYALALTLVGYLTGLAQDEAERSPLAPFVVVAAATAGCTALYAGLGALFSEVGVDGAALALLLPTSVLYNVLLAPFVVPAVTALARRAPSPTSYGGRREHMSKGMST